MFFSLREDSCGFEHVFVGETKYGQEIMGLHNWVQFYLQEKHGNIDYKGYKARAKKDTVRKYYEEGKPALWKSSARLFIS